MKKELDKVLTGDSVPKAVIIESAKTGLLNFK
jgi:hypothetical protein